MENTMNIYRILIEKPLGRPKTRWKENVMIGFRERGYGDGRWMELAQDRVK
jgi:hypothetical protein